MGFSVKIQVVSKVRLRLANFIRILCNKQQQQQRNIYWWEWLIFLASRDSPLKMPAAVVSSWCWRGSQPSGCLRSSGSWPRRRRSRCPPPPGWSTTAPPRPPSGPRWGCSWRRSERTLQDKNVHYIDLIISWVIHLLPSLALIFIYLLVVGVVGVVFEVVVHCCPLFSHCCPFLPIIVHCSSLLPIAPKVSNCVPNCPKNVPKVPQFASKEP